MECVKLIPGQPLLRNLSTTSADFMVVLSKGRVRAGEKSLDAPRVICGFDRLSAAHLLVSVFNSST